MPKTITNAVAQRLTAKKGRDRTDYFDSSYPGLALRVSQTGRKSWTYFYRLKNGATKQHRMTLGIYPAVSVEQAHQSWREAFDLVRAGRDPQAVAESTLPPLSFEGVFEEWLKRDQSGHRSAKLIEARLRKYVLPAWRNRLITEIDKRACLDVIDNVADAGKATLARRLHSHIHRLFAWCIGRDIIKTNPLQNVEKPGSETSRERVLTECELVKVWRAAEALPALRRDAFRLLILTGCRKNEISELRWSEITEGGTSIELSGARTKNGEPHIIPLSTVARSIIATIERKDEYVFGGIAHWGRPKEKLDEVSDVKDWVIHDLRRTVATGLQKLGVALPVTESVLGHTGGSRAGIVGIYQRHDYSAEKRSALEAWGSHVIALVEGAERGKVIAWGR